MMARWQGLADPRLSQVKLARIRVQHVAPPPKAAGGSAAKVDQARVHRHVAVPAQPITFPTSSTSPLVDSESGVAAC